MSEPDTLAQGDTARQPVTSNEPSTVRPVGGQIGAECAA